LEGQGWRLGQALLGIHISGGMGEGGWLGGSFVRRKEFSRHALKRVGKNCMGGLSLYHPKGGGAKAREKGPLPLQKKCISEKILNPKKKPRRDKFYEKGP